MLCVNNKLNAVDLSLSIIIPRTQGGRAVVAGMALEGLDGGEEGEERRVRLGALGHDARQVRAQQRAVHPAGLISGYSASGRF